MDFIEFCEDVLGHPLSGYQKTYLTNMYDMFTKAKEENKAINFNMAGRGSSKFNFQIAAFYLASEYYKCSKGYKMDDIESLNAVMGPVKMVRSDAIDEVLGNDKGEKDG